MPRRRAIATILLAGSVVSAGVAQRQDAPFQVEEATIAAVHAAFKGGTLTCRRLVELYLARIKAYEDGGPRLNAITTVNPQVLKSAAALDARWQQSGPAGPLHCIPVLLKDNINTADMPTTSGSAILRNAIPREDAPIVTSLKRAGALILGKASLGELAAGSYNTVDGQQLNPYNFRRNPGGSSSGSAVAVAANLTMVAVGTDTFTSVRAPAALTGIVGLRPTTGLVSGKGIAPRKENVDTAGPMARTVTDAAILLNALAASGTDFTRELRAGALKGARVGVVRDFFGGDPEVDALATAAVARMESLGASTVEVRLDPEFLERYVRNALTNVYPVLMYRFRESWEAYLDTSFGPGVPKTVAEWVRIYETELAKAPIPAAIGGFSAHAVLKESLAHSSKEPAYGQMIDTVLPALTKAKLALFQQHNVDALVFPYAAAFAGPIRNPVQSLEDPAYVPAPGRPNPSTLGGYSSVGFPMLVVPMGLGSQGLPMGLAIMGRPREEARILGYAYDYEQATRLRRPSPLVPPLPGG
jgi:amidase